MMKEILVLFISAVLVSSCSEGHKADSIIEQAIAYSNLEKLPESIVSFQFRKYTLKIQENQGNFLYQRSFQDSVGQHFQIYSKDTLIYTVNNQPQELTEKRKTAIIESINSQVYFNQLPYKLNDPAVIKEYLGTESINNQNYHKIKVSFEQEGGGVDFEDEFIYWFDTEDYSMDYLAYEFHVNGGGIRFREGVNPRFINDIFFQDYNNYKPEGKSKLDSVSILYKQDKLIKLSEINITDIVVEEI